MFIKEIELVHFKCHSNCRFQFGKVNHFSGDNYSGKSSIGESIVFCLFGVTKHGYKMYVKDYLQEGQTSMKVNMNIRIDNEEFRISRTMNAKGTTKVFLNNKLVKEKEIQLLLGDFKTFIYSFFPEFFPEEEKKNARSFIIDQVMEEKDSIEKLEGKLRSLQKQQREINSSITFYEGQKSLLRKQIDSSPSAQTASQTLADDAATKKEQLQEELHATNIKMQRYLAEEMELQSKLNNSKEKLKDIQSSVPLSSEHCPTCKQKIPKELLHYLQVSGHEMKNKWLQESDLLERDMHTKRREYSRLSSNKLKLEKELNEIGEYLSATTNELKKQQSTALRNVEEKLRELFERKNILKEDVKHVKHQLGQVANDYQSLINQHLVHTRIDLFKRLNSGELRPDFQITYKNRPYRVLSYSEKIRCIIEIIPLLNRRNSRSYPIFLDNLESITHITPPDTQIFAATVKKGIPLTLKIRGLS